MEMNEELIITEMQKILEQLGPKADFVYAAAQAKVYAVIYNNLMAIVVSGLLFIVGEYFRRKSNLSFGEFVASTPLSILWLTGATMGGMYTLLFFSKSVPMLIAPDYYTLEAIKTLISSGM